MELNRLIEINQNSYLQSFRFNNRDYQIIDRTLDLLTAHHESNDKPKVGDLIEGAYYDGAYPYKYGRIESIEDDKITICCKPYVPFVSFNKNGKLYLSMSGGPFIVESKDKLQLVGEDQAQYAIWGCQGACANGAIHVETTVKRWKIPYTRKPVSFVTEIKEVNLQHNPRLDAKVIIHKDHMYYFARYNNMQQLQALAKVMGFTLSLNKEDSKDDYKKYNLSHQFVDGPYFWCKEQLPRKAKPFITLSNGSLCTCYFVRDDNNKEIIIYRPNANSKDVYDAFPIEKHIEYKKEHGEAGPVISLTTDIGNSLITENGKLVNQNIVIDA